MMFALPRRLILSVFCCVVPGTVFSQVRVEPAVGIALRNQLLQGSAFERDGTPAGEFETSFKSAPLVGIRLSAPLTPRFDLLGSYATAWTAYAFSLNGRKARSDIPVHLNLMAAQVSFGLTEPGSKTAMAVSAGPAIVVFGDSPIDLDSGNWGGVVGLEVHRQLTQSLQIGAIPNAYFYKHGGPGLSRSEQSFTLSLGLTYTP